MKFDRDALEDLRVLLCSMQDVIQSVVVESRRASSNALLATVDSVTEADTLYHIDRLAEERILSWLDRHWPEQWSVELVMEGIDPVVFPNGLPPRDCKLKCIIDPIDGTRGLMYDKRPAWTLAGLAPQRGPATRLGDIVVASMTELPVSKQRLADQVSAVRGCGSGGIVAERVDLDSDERFTVELVPSAASTLDHGFAAFARFLPAAKGLIARFEERLFEEIYAARGEAVPMIFNDQYICSGGQFYELLAGHDRLMGDLRPLAYAELGLTSSISCHPYDVCTGLILQEAGCPLSDALGNRLDAPLDTTSAVSWVGFANRALADEIKPVLARVMREHFPAGLRKLETPRG